MKYQISFDLDFQRNPYKGLYIVFEGVNASGKTTQVERIKNYFEGQGKTVVVTSEPNDQLPIGKIIREIITSKNKFPSTALQYLYTADRVVNHETIIIPALKRGEIVISSRSFWSALVYGVMDRGGVEYTRPSADLLLAAQGALSMYHQFLLPDFTFFLDVSLAAVLERISKMEKGRDIYEKREKLEQLIKGYRWVAGQFAKEIITIDGEGEQEEIAQEVLGMLSEKV